jgi:hypothetical protein
MSGYATRSDEGKPSTYAYGPIDGTATAAKP